MTACVSLNSSEWNGTMRPMVLYVDYILSKSNGGGHSWVWDTISHLSWWLLSTNNKSWQGCGERGTLLRYWWECRLVQPLWKAVWRNLKKLKMKLSYDPVISPLLLYLKKLKTLIWKNTSTPTFIAVLFTITKMWKQPKCPSIDEWMKQLWEIYTMECVNLLLSRKKRKKKRKSYPLWQHGWTWNIMLSEISQSEKEKCHIISFMCGI